MIYDFPLVTPNSIDFGLEFNGQEFKSELNGSVQQSALPGDRWTATLTYSNVIDPAKARTLRAFLAKLRFGGMFWYSPHDYRRAGAVGGVPLVNGANQTGSTLTIDGCTANVTGWLMEGDYFQVGNELKMITADANTSATGTVTLQFAPPLRTSPADNSAIITTKPSCVMQLADGNQARWQAQPTPIYALSIACKEYLP